MTIAHCRPALLLAAVVAAAGAPPAQADGVSKAEFEALLRRVAELEATRCPAATVAPAAAEPAPPPASAAALDARVEQLEHAVAAFEPAAETVNGWAGVELGADLLVVGQQFDPPLGSGRYANYRLDGSLLLPAGAWQRAAGQFFLHLRAGQSPAPAELPVTFSGLNATAFQLGGTSAPEDAALTLTEAGYRLDFPLGRADGPEQQLSFTLGKLDPFVYFDQNAYANDEATQFLSAPFVHNALLDNPLAAQIGTDAYGASPGLVLAYQRRIDEQTIGLGWGHFSSGEDANYSSALDRELDLVQLEWQVQPAGRPGSYRLLGFRNQAGPGFDDTAEASRGWTLSFDQEVADGVGLFLRHGEARHGRLPFDRSTAFGVELAGARWSRPDDRVGLAAARLRTSDAFRREAPVHHHLAYRPDGAEALIEFFYRYALNAQLHASVHLQHLHDPGGNPAAGELDVLSVRLGASY